MTHQLTKTEANVSTTPHQKGTKNAPILSSVNSSQNDFFCESKSSSTPLEIDRSRIVPVRVFRILGFNRLDD